MKAEKAIVYDHSCPMCRWYTGAFVKADLLQAENRISFHELEQSRLHTQLDLDRSRHEIPLLDLEGGDTIYGLDSLVYLLGHRFPIIPRLMRYPLLNGFFRRLYKLVSYNRRIIAASPKTEGGFDCTPDFNLRYRLFYVAFALLSAGVIWSLLLAQLPMANLILLALLLPLLASIFLEKEKGISWAGHWSTVLLIGALVGLPLLAFPLMYLYWFGGVFCFMLWQTKIRIGIVLS